MKKILFSVLIVATAMIALANPVSAWSGAPSASAICRGPEAIVLVEFTNTEVQLGPAIMVELNEHGEEVETEVPAEDMTMVVSTSLDGGASSSLGVATAGQRVNGTIPTGLAEFSGGSVTFTVTWADGRPGTDAFTTPVSAIRCETPETTPEPTPEPTPPEEEPEVIIPEPPTPPVEPTPESPEPPWEPRPERPTPNEPVTVISAPEPPAPVLDEQPEELAYTGTQTNLLIGFGLAGVALGIGFCYLAERHRAKAWDELRKQYING